MRKVTVERAALRTFERAREQAHHAVFGETAPFLTRHARHYKRSEGSNSAMPSEDLHTMPSDSEIAAAHREAAHLWAPAVSVPLERFGDMSAAPA